MFISVAEENTFLKLVVCRPYRDSAVPAEGRVPLLSNRSRILNRSNAAVWALRRVSAERRSLRLSVREFGEAMKTQMRGFNRGGAMKIPIY